nr:ATP-binding sensor histidine kinase [Okeania sp. KiyG1]
MNFTITPLSNYEIGDLIHESKRTVVYRGVAKADAQPVAIKLMRNQFPAFNELVQFRNQYTIASNLSIEGIVKPLALLSYQNGYALIMPDIGGISLGEYYQNLSPHTKYISQFLDIAIEIAEIIYQLHQNRIIHKDIKPANILINPETKQIKIIDFSISTLLPKETQTIQTPNVLEGTLAYISPEQTGRMNRGIDYRSDFYSLGVTFYEILNGTLPFETTDLMELVHCHLAKMPVLGNREQRCDPASATDASGQTPRRRQSQAVGPRDDASRKRSDPATTPVASGRTPRRRQSQGNADQERERRPREGTPTKRGNADQERECAPREGVGSREGRTGNSEESKGVCETQIPQMLIDIVMKLMAKNAEDRYQSALGLKYDLEKCRQEWEEKGEIESFELGSRDISDRFLIPEKLYGREAEVQTLLDAFERVAHPPVSKEGGGRAEMMLVAGFSGIGKTVVVNEVHKPIVRQRGYFIKGKFDQFNRNIPFSAFVQGFRDLMGQLLSESDAQLEEWKNKILDAVGENGQVIIEVIPELEKIIGKQPSVADLSGSAAQNRFNLLFGKFIQVFTTKEHPLVIFLDDLQWADSASLNLMKLLMSEASNSYLLTIGAYRDNEVFPTHPLMLTLDEMVQAEATINTITLAPLSQDNINHLVADTLSCDLEVAKPLTDLVYQKTKGNPFFTTQFLLGLYGDELISFNFELRHWECDIARVKQRALTDDVVEFMAERLQKLPSETIEVLKLAACIGNQFDLATLAIVCEQSEMETSTALWRALQEGFILPQSEVYKFYFGQEQQQKFSPAGISELVNYKFLHDRVQQAAYSLIPQERQHYTHLQIGRLLASHTKPTEIEGNIFNIVSQFNAGIEFVTQQKEKNEIARYNLIASCRAKNSAAYQPAWNYAKIGIGLLGPQCWQNCYQLTLQLYEESVELAYLNGDFETMEKLSEIFFNKANTFLERIKIYQVKIQACVAQDRLLDGVAIGLNALKSLGVNLPEEPTEEDLQQGRSEIAFLTKDREIPDLANLPQMTNPKILAKVQILSSLFALTFFTNPNLCWLTVIKQIILSLKHGNAPVSAFAYANYGMMKCGILQDIEIGYQFGQLALSVLSQLNVRSLEAKTLYIINTGISHWKESLHDTVPNFKEVYLKGLETGDFEFSGYGGISYCYFSYIPGKELKELSRDMEIYGLKMQEIQQQSSLNLLNIFWQAVMNLQQESQAPWNLDGEIYNEHQFLPIYLQSNNYLALGYLYFNKLILAYLFSNYPEAGIICAESEKYLSVLTGTPVLPPYFLYNSLTKLALYSESTEEAREQIWLQLAKNQEKLKDWAHHAPMNCQHKYDLVEAEKARVLGEKWQAGELYDKAISGAKENEYIQEEALANELAAKFYLELGKDKIAAGYMQDAYYCYARWGAKAKVEDLEKRYPFLLKPIIERQLYSSTSSATSIDLTQGTISKTTTGSGEMLDLATLMKASRTLSEDISLEGAITNLMQVVRENAGAETVALMLFTDQVLMLTALVTGPENSTLTPLPVVITHAVPLSIVNQVKHSQKPLVLDNASNNNAYAGDAYIQKYQPQSIFCLPLIARGKLIGILYLENNQVAGAFTQKRVEVLNLLCSQAAISLENAQLYQQAQQALTDLQKAQLQLVQTEKMATLGNLMAGVAHEINNPLGFMGGNINIIQEYLADLFTIIERYQEELPNPSPGLTDEIEELELDFLMEDLPKTIASMETGIRRIGEISVSLRTFSRTDTENKSEFNLHDGLDSTLLILKYRLKANDRRPGVKVIKDYGDLPNIQCYPGQLNQVFMNIIANAIDALDEANEGQTFREIEANNNCVTISTKLSTDKNMAVVEIADNGPGMSEQVRSRIFEQGFTTKGVGKGTGLGMAISQQIIQAKHGGTIDCISALGKGTKFIITLPLS